MPGVAAPARAWENVVNREIAPGQARVALPVARARATVNTAIAIALQHPLPAPGNTMPGNLNVPPKTHHARQAEDAGYAMNGQDVIGSGLDAFAHEQRNSPLVRDDGDRFVGGVEE